MTTPDSPRTMTQSCVSAQSPLIFMHIPKTGGMSMFTAFTAHWGTHIADLYNVSPRNAPLAQQALQDPAKALFCGHYAFGLHQWMTRPAYYASVLREPVARLESLYHYCLPILNVHRKRLQELGGDLARLAAQPRISDFYLDFGPWLTGEPTPEAFFASPSAELDNGMVRRFSGFGMNPAPCPASALAQAKQNIEASFSVVGLLERYPETLQLMAQTFGLPDLNAHHVNANKEKANKAPLSEGILQKIRDMNQLDLALYDWVCARFDSQLAQPRPAVQLAGGGRTDVAAMPLWRAVGQSPLREAAMKQKGLPTMAKPGQAKPAQALLCKRVTGSSMSPRAVMADVETALIQQDQPPKPGPKTRLVFEPKTAKLMVTALSAAIKAYELKHGSIAD